MNHSMGRAPRVHRWGNFAWGIALAIPACSGETTRAGESIQRVTQAAVTPTKITTLAQLRAMVVTGSYELGSDIDASSTASTPFVPIGTQASPFSGFFDGKTFKINNLTIAGNRNYAGMFGYASGATIQNVKLNSVKLSNGSSYTYTGAIVGYMTATNLYDSQVSGTVTGGSTTGGLVGYATGGSNLIGGSVTSLSVNGGSYVGGLVGYLTGSSYAINGTSSGGSVTGADSTGGMVGRASSGSLSYSNATALNVNGTTNTGGLVGSLTSGTIAYDSATGTVKGTDRTGGVAGAMTEGIAIFDSATNITVNGAADTGGLVGLLTRSTMDTGNVSGSITGGANTGGLIGRMIGTLARRSVLTLAYIDEKSAGNPSVVTGGTPVGMGVGSVQSYTDLTKSYAIGKVTGSSTRIGGFMGEINATGIALANDEPRANVEEIFTQVEVTPAFDNTTSNVFAGGLVGRLLGASIKNINVAGSVKGRNYVGGAIGYAVNDGANVTGSILRSILTRGEVTNIAVQNRSGTIGGVSSKFMRCGRTYWDTTTDGGSAPPLPADEDPSCEVGLTSTQLKAPEKLYVDADHPNGNYDIFTYGMIIDREYQATWGALNCQLGSGSDGDFGFAFCYGVEPSAEPPVWVMNSGTEYNTLVNIPRPERQPKN
ncbi:MAG TPA: hypothetical protein VFQ61_32095 [Polyangiaceae bacterium]|nr:hypothetical protein [Polyangiaceae bacterium]